MLLGRPVAYIKLALSNVKYLLGGDLKIVCANNKISRVMSKRANDEKH